MVNKMNGYERCQAALQWLQPDRIPVVPQNSDMAISMSGYSMYECLHDPSKLASALLEAQEIMQYDGILLGPDAAILAEAVGCEVEYRDNNPPAVVSPILSDLSEIEKLSSVNLVENKRIRTWLEATEVILQKTKGETFVICRADQGAFSLATLLLGNEQMMYALALGESDKEIMKLLAFCNDLHIQFAHLIKSTGAHATTCGDAFCGPGLISPFMYQKYALPFQQEAARQITKQIGLAYSIHICGTTNMIHDLWATSGATFFEVDHCTDIEKLRKETLNRIALLGNLDTASLCSDTPSDIKEKCKELFQVMMPASGFLLSSGCSMSGNTKLENVQAMVEASKEFGEYK